MIFLNRNIEPWNLFWKLLHSLIVIQSPLLIYHRKNNLTILLKKDRIIVVDNLEEHMLKMNEKGQALVEYLLIIAIISVIVVGIVKLLGGYLQDSITKTSCSLVNKVYVEGDKPGEGQCVDP